MNSDYMMPEVTRTVNGIFIGFVFLRHIFQYRAFDGGYWQLLHWVDHHLGQFLVVSFLFFSGYGIMESWKKRGMEYIYRLPGHRFLGTWLRFVCCVLIYLVVGLAMGEEYSLRQLPGFFLGWRSAGNSNWYICVILMLYLLTWLAFVVADRLAKGEKTGTCALVIHFLLVMVLAWVLAKYQPDYWYNTIFVYTAGMTFSWYRPRWDRFFETYRAAHLLFWMVEAAGLWICYHHQENILAYELAAVLFAGLIVWSLGRCPLRSRIFGWLGANLFGMFMMQRIPMIVFAQTKLPDLIYLVICVILTLLLGWVMDQSTKFIMNGMLRL